MLIWYSPSLAWRLLTIRRIRSQALPFLFWPQPSFPGVFLASSHPLTLCTHTFSQTSCHLPKTLHCLSPMCLCCFSPSAILRLAHLINSPLVQANLVSEALPHAPRENWPLPSLIPHNPFLSLCDSFYHSAGHLWRKGKGYPQIYGIPTMYLTQQ